MADVFISYAREDQAVAKLLAELLCSLGWSVWWDRYVLVGDDFTSAVDDELHKAVAVVSLFSKASVGKEWVLVEATHALKRGALVPVRIEDVEVPAAFCLRQYADLINWSGDPRHDGFFKLHASILNKTRREKEGVQGRLAIVEKKKAELDQMLGIPPAHFLPLSRKIRDFNGHVLTFGYLLVSCVRRLSRDDAERLRKSISRSFDGTHDALVRDRLSVLQSICDTAVAVIDASRGLPKPTSSAHIQAVILSSKDLKEGVYVPVYVPVVRSSHASNGRLQDDNRLLKAEIAVGKNRLFASLFSEKPVSNWFRIVDDMDEFLSAHPAVGGDYTEPLPTASKLYKSCLIVPIPDLRDDDVLMGFICIDSPDREAFKGEYALLVLQELAHFASMIYTFHEAITRAVKEPLRRFIEGTDT